MEVIKMKIIAKQVPPEYQDSNFDPECWPGVIFHGNRDYHSRTTPIFESIIERFYTEKHILRALYFMTGKKYERHTIRGCCQRDWQDIYYPAADYSRDSLEYLEIEYFNLGTEWVITSAEDPDGYGLYCYATDTDAIRAEIADATGENPENVILQTFTGWKRLPEYTEV